MIVWSGLLMDDLKIQAPGEGEAKWVEVWLPQCIDKDFRI
jgi:hypothetical protein